MSNKTLTPIKLLPSDVISKIAAGEVVERPASIVKELIENALDAESTEIKVIIKNAGLDLIEVCDNGKGIGVEDLKLAKVLHATSKLTSIENLTSLETLGFRGEALASIAAVTDTEITSATNNSEAWKLATDNIVNPSARSQGTTVTVKNLFRQVPARRKFLKANRTEENLIRNLVRNFALLFPQVIFSYTVDEKLIWNLEKSDLKTRIEELFGIEAKDLIALNHKNLQGYLGAAKLAARKPQAQLITINNRIVKSTTVMMALKQAYKEQIPYEYKPVYFVFLQLPGLDVDVNVHPRKEEVKFSDDGKVFELVFSECRKALTASLRQQFETRMGKPATETEDYSSSPTDLKNMIGNLAEEPQISYQSNLDSFRNNSKHIPPQYNSTLSQQIQTIENNLAIDSKFEYLQIFSTYILIEKNGKLLLIDQHAAAERITYERLKEQFLTNKIEKSPFLIAETIELDRVIVADPQQFITSFAELGFEIELFHEAPNSFSFKLLAVPTLLQKGESWLEQIRNVLSDLKLEKVNLTEVSHHLDIVCATMACHSSIRAGQTLQKTEVLQLIKDLWSCKDPYTCPHGRPIIVEFTKSELEKRFLRQK